MELLEGRSLELGPVDFDAVEVMLQVAEGLEAVHAAGLVHRDLKPANVFLCRDGRAVLTDFGLVRDPDLTALTKTGHVVGSLAYMPPEVLLGESPGAPSDWYSWGVSLFRILEGRLPFRAEQLVGVAQGEPLPGLVFEEVDPASPVAALLRRQISADKEGRLQGRAAIEDFLERPVEAPPVSPTRSQAFSLVSGGPSGRRAPRVVLGLAAVGFVGWLLHGGRTVGPVVSQAPPAHTSPLGDEIAMEVREQLSAAGELMVDELGRVHELPEGSIPETWRHLVNGDPHHYLALVAQMPSLGLWYDFLSAGGVPEALPEEQRQRLREADERFRVVGLPAPFGPFLGGPSKPRLPPGIPDTVWGRSVPFPDPPGPWLARALEEYRAGTVERERLKEELPTLGDHPRRFLDETTRVQLEIFRSAQNPLNSTLREMGRTPAARPFVSDWTRPGAEHLIALLYAAGRSAREDPEQAGVAALTGYIGLAHLETFRASVIAWMPRTALLGPPGDALPHRFLDLAVRRSQLSGRGSLSEGRAEEIRAILEAAGEILSTDAASEEASSRAMVDLAVGSVASWAAREGGRGEAWVEMLEPYVPVLARQPGAYGEIWRAVIDTWSRRPELFLDRPDLARDLVAPLEACRSFYLGERRANLEKALPELRAAGGG
jgi:hypothetical protein